MQTLVSRLTTTHVEPVFANRVPLAPPDRPFPSSHRAIFFDVENTSRAAHIARVIEHLAVDRVGRRTDFVALARSTEGGPEPCKSRTKDDNARHVIFPNARLELISRQERNQAC